jgi:hypothetical protein
MSIYRMTAAMRPPRAPVLGLHNPFLLTRGTLSRRNLAQFVSAIDTWRSVSVLDAICRSRYALPEQLNQEQRAGTGEIPVPAPIRSR